MRRQARRVARTPDQQDQVSCNTCSGNFRVLWVLGPCGDVLDTSWPRWGGHQAAPSLRRQLVPGCVGRWLVLLRWGLCGGARGRLLPVLGPHENPGQKACSEGQAPHCPTGPRHWARSLAAGGWDTGPETTPQFRPVNVADNVSTQVRIKDFPEQRLFFDSESRELPKLIGPKASSFSNSAAPGLPQLVPPSCGTLPLSDSRD